MLRIYVWDIISLIRNVDLTKCLRRPPNKNYFWSTSRAIAVIAQQVEAVISRLLESTKIPLYSRCLNI